VYKLLLCWRYLLTRYLALVCIVSVMLGVATLIVVNSVMSGFSTKLRDRLHGLLSDVVIEAYDMEGFANPEGKMEVIRSDPALAGRIEAMTPTLEIFAMLQFNYQGNSITKPVHLIGIDPEGRSEVGGFGEHLLLNPGRPSFELSPEAKKRQDWLHPEQHRFFNPNALLLSPDTPTNKPAPDPPESKPFVPTGIILGDALVRMRYAAENGEVTEAVLREPGDDVTITTISSMSGDQLRPVYKRYAVCDYFRSEMSEYDSSFVFVPIQDLQQLRTMEGRATSIQIRLKDYQRDHKAVVARLQALMGSRVKVETWEQKQGALLSAIDIEKGILNVLLFMIVAVAGFGILAIFSMIVFEKTRDIGILKALGASNGGIMKIFLGYGLLLGVVGASLGTVIGVLFTLYINPIEQTLSRLTGHEIFNRQVYYFKDIPTDMQPLSVLLINVGAIGIAVLFSVLPAMRAALLHPVRALRYE
jgi:lipoprotein-releasing system permease protein